MFCIWTSNSKFQIMGDLFSGHHSWKTLHYWTPISWNCSSVHLIQTCWRCIKRHNKTCTESRDMRQEQVSDATGETNRFWYCKWLVNIGLWFLDNHLKRFANLVKKPSGFYVYRKRTGTSPCFSWVKSTISTGPCSVAHG